MPGPKGNCWPTPCRSCVLKKKYLVFLYVNVYIYIYVIYAIFMDGRPVGSFESEGEPWASAVWEAQFNFETATQLPILKQDGRKPGPVIVIHQPWEAVYRKISSIFGQSASAPSGRLKSPQSVANRQVLSLFHICLKAEVFQPNERVFFLANTNPQRCPRGCMSDLRGWMERPSKTFGCEQ